MKTRQIDITKQDIRCCDELIIDDDNIEATYELWFDVDKYFGTETMNDDSTWINFYTFWYPDGTITAWYCIDSELTSEHKFWKLTEEEKEFFRNKMENYCQQCNGMSLMELWNKYNDESEVVKMEINKEQIQELINAYESNNETLRNIDKMFDDYGHVGNGNTPEETHEQGYNDALEFVFKVLGIEY